MKLDSSTTHVAFSDESHFNVGRYRSIGVVSAPHNNALSSHKHLEEILENVSELKWSKIRNERYEDAALRTIKYTINQATNINLRVDVIIWDTHDSRHDVMGRDDEANLQRMYYHIFSNVFKERWPDESEWTLYPDMQSMIDWGNIENFLEYAAYEVPEETQIVHDGVIDFGAIKERFNIRGVNPSPSSGMLLIQVADLFAGIGVYSHSKFQRYKTWLSKERDQTTLEITDTVELSNADNHRCPLIWNLNQLCKRNSLNVSLERDEGFKTYLPSKPINFWFYEPQHGEDKAPIR